LKYHLSRPALEGLGAARDKGMHLILAHQSLGDLRDCPADLDAEAVVDGVVENCRLRVAYRVINPETAEWLAAMSGEILVDDETRRVERNAAGSEVMDHERTVRQATRYLVDVNMLLNLPDHEAPSVEIEKPAVPNIAPQALANATEGVGHADALPIPTKSLQSAEVKPEKPASPKKDLAAQLIDLEDHDVDI